MQQSQETAQIPVMPEGEWEKIQGEEFGGKAPILSLSVGACAGPFAYVGANQITTELGQVTSHVATFNGSCVRLPISATFQRAVEEADLIRGDLFAVRRWPDVIKKTGKGRGQKMEVYGLKVISRIPREPAAETP